MWKRCILPDLYLIARAKTSDKTFDGLFQVIRDHKEPKPSIIVSRYKFNSYQRVVGQPVADFVSALRRATENCCFRATLDYRLTEQFVCGIVDERMGRRLLSETSLDFSSTQKICLAIETAGRDAHLISGTPVVRPRGSEVRPQGSFNI